MSSKLRSPLIFNESGSFKKAKEYLEALKDSKILRMKSIVEKYGEMGVKELAAVTPVDTGKTAASWYYKVVVDTKRKRIRLIFANSNIATTENGHRAPVALILYYGHGTRNGGYVEPNDFITPVTQPIYEKLASELWSEVNSIE